MNGSWLASVYIGFKGHYNLRLKVRFR
jgi:hypothetical protein